MSAQTGPANGEQEAQQGNNNGANIYALPSVDPALVVTASERILAATAELGSSYDGNSYESFVADYRGMDSTPYEYSPFLQPDANNSRRHPPALRSSGFRLSKNLQTFYPRLSIRYPAEQADDYSHEVSGWAFPAVRG